MKINFARQSFLGDKSEEQISSVRVAIIGLGGGGSHICQQLAHVGVEEFLLFDPDIVEDTNLNRLVGASLEDVENKEKKVDIAKRTIARLSGKAKVEAYHVRWQEKLVALKSCDIIFGCVDGLLQRRDLEAFSRRYLIPYIDIGMDVHKVGSDPPRVAGQVILSVPGYACMQCMGFLRKENLDKEGAQYGDAGGNPQVVWCNGVLASTAVALAIDLITDWSGSLRSPVYLSYDGNRNTMEPDKRLQFIDLTECPHYPVDQIGDPKYRRLE